VAATVVFCAVAGLGPLLILFHHWLLTGDALAFYRGPYSPRAIQHGADYPGYHNWGDAFFYYRSAAQICAGTVLSLAALVGAAVACYRRAFWAVALLALPGVFLVWAMYSTGGTPIFLPTFKPFSHYNTRYGMAVLPLLALAAAALVTLAPARIRAWSATLLVVAATLPWALHPSPSHWITWEESRVNSEARRAWTAEAADYMKSQYVHGTGILGDAGDLRGIYREAGIPLREVFNVDNGLPFQATILRPELFLHEQWIVTQGGGQAQTASIRAGLRGKEYRLVKQIIVKDAPVIEIYRR
jgi:hypothetical protein